MSSLMYSSDRSCPFLTTGFWPQVAVIISETWQRHLDTSSKGRWYIHIPNRFHSELSCFNSHTAQCVLGKNNNLSSIKGITNNLTTITQSSEVYILQQTTIQSSQELSLTLWVIFTFEIAVPPVPPKFVKSLLRNHPSLNIKVQSGTSTASIFKKWHMHSKNLVFTPTGKFV